MDAGSIFSNAIGGLIGSLALLLVVEFVKHMRISLKRRATRPKEVLNQALLASEAYKEVRHIRHFYRMIGYLFLGAFLLFIIFIVAVIPVQTVLAHWDKMIFPALLLCEVPLALYLGYSPITAREVELKRQQQRAKTFKQAQGGRSYGYIFYYIVFPPVLWLFSVSYFIGMIFFLAGPSQAPYSISEFWRVIGIIVLAILSILFTVFLARRTYFSVKYLKYLSLEKQRELRTQFIQNEFEQ